MEVLKSVFFGDKECIDKRIVSSIVQLFGHKWEEMTEEERKSFLLWFWNDRDAVNYAYNVIRMEVN